jgi:hypothetical protein
MPQEPPKERGKRMPEELPPPVALAMIICDAIWRDPGTGKLTILGVFSELGARNFPAVHPMLAVHVAPTDGQGKIAVKLRLIDVDEEQEPLFETEQEFEFPDRRAIINMNLHMGGIAFPRAGEYRLQLFARNEFLMERRILVRELTA